MYLKKTAAFIFVMIIVQATGVCAPVADQADPRASDTFDTVTGRNWFLVEVRKDPLPIILDRSKLAADGFGEAFTLRFDEERISGAGAPNRYIAPYTLSGSQAITFGMIAATLMAAIFEPDEFKEHEYFTLLQNVSRWNITGENLELFSGETVLVFTVPDH